LVQVVFQIIDVHEPGYGNTVFFKDENLSVEVHAADDLPEIYAGLG
jgi:hypothetical protein